MARNWPANEIAPWIALIDDPRHKLNEDGTYRLSDAQARAILEQAAARDDQDKASRLMLLAMPLV